jgi:hypothetical protein
MSNMSIHPGASAYQTSREAISANSKLTDYHPGASGDYKVQNTVRPDILREFLDCIEHPIGINAT